MAEIREKIAHIIHSIRPLDELFCRTGFVTPFAYSETRLQEQPENIVESAIVIKYPEQVCNLLLPKERLLK